MRREVRSAFPASPFVVELGWTATFALCPPDGGAACGPAAFAATRAGSLVHSVAGDAEMSSLGDPDRTGLVRFLDDPTVVAAIRGSSRCTQVLDATFVVTLTGSDDSQISRDVTGCRGSPFDALDAWIETFRAYFP